VYKLLNIGDKTPTCRTPHLTVKSLLRVPYYLTADLNLLYLQGGPKIGLFLNVNNFLYVT